ncbi:hypothetical protein [Rhodoplanes elegans]|uniref:hypothetical protein n=1 Tax=Rhodoplanes elegans TaxID=29408 RepID=UPI0011B94AB0|nr:hypothetical protein [Rhodoplanes elegans]
MDRRSFFRFVGLAAPAAATALLPQRGYATGGVVGPGVRPFIPGAGRICEAGPEAVMPLRMTIENRVGAAIIISAIGGKREAGH